MTSTAHAPAAPASPGRRPHRHLRVVTASPRRTPVLAGVGLYLAGLAAGSLLVAATTAVSGGSGAVASLLLAAAAGAGSLVAARGARARATAGRGTATHRCAAPAAVRRAA